MIFSLGRRQGEVGVKVRVIVFGVGIVLVLLLRVLLLGAPWRTIIRHPIIGGDILLEGVVGSNSPSLDDGLLGNLMGLSDIFFVHWKRRG
jgi:hypothetical protein